MTDLDSYPLLKGGIECILLDLINYMSGSLRERERATVGNLGK